MDVDDREATLDFFLTWKLDALKTFLEKRGLSREGTKAELAALCFAAHKMKVPINPTFTEVLKEKKRAYLNLLEIDPGVTLPDPFTLSAGWNSEKDSIHLWPPVYLSDITQFFIKNCPDTTTQHFLNEYKVGKAYEYFSCHWLKEIFIQRYGKYCILRASCTPSMRLSNADHKVWVCVEHKMGTIKSAYCSCTAGLGQTCNHIAGLLFRLEHANRNGLSNPSCTSLPCSWVIPNEKVTCGPKRLSEMMVKKSRHGKLDNARPLVLTSKRKFKPLQEPAADPLQSIGKALKDILPDACLYKGLSLNEQRDEPLNCTTNQNLSDTEQTIEDKITPIMEYSRQFKPGQETEFMTDFPKLTKEGIKDLADRTTEQSLSSKWHEARKGRITASRFYAVHTKVQTLKSNPNTDTEPLLRNLVGETGLTDPDKLPRAIKHGRNMEPEAKKMFLCMQMKKHDNLRVTDCGIFLHEENQFLGASPDGLVSCNCCGEGVLEIKCPLITPCALCNPNICNCRNKLLSYLYEKNKTLHLKCNHNYYGQIQGQMAITGRKYCDFYIYSPFAQHCERIKFDPVFWEQMYNNLVYFYTHYMIQYIIRSGDIRENMSEAEQMDVDLPLATVESQVFFCPACNELVKEEENVKSFGERSVCCDTCNKWYHFKCVKMTKSALKSAKFWYCYDCK